MTPQQIEAWALSVVDAVLAGQRVEDDRVECKREWPADHDKAARRIAGHANAARGSSILWVIGVDEDGHTVPGASDTDLANWWPQVEKRFDEIAPSITTLVVPTPAGHSVVALYFETERAPYVVNTGQATVTKEVPYRSATRIRSARRHELIRLVVPEAQTPALEVINASVRCHVEKHHHDTEVVEVSGSGQMFFEGTGQLMLPAHRSEAIVHLSGPGGDVAIPTTVHFSKVGSSWFPVIHRPDTPRPPADPVPAYGIDVRNGDIYLTGPGTARYSISGTAPAPAFAMIRAARSGRFECRLGMANSDRSVTGALDLRWDERNSSDNFAEWVGGPADA